MSKAKSTKIFRNEPTQKHITWPARENDSAFSDAGKFYSDIDGKTARMLDLILKEERNSAHSSSRVQFKLAGWVIRNKIKAKLKRAFDILLVSISLPFSLPIIAVTALAIKIDSPGPVIFKQERVGKRGKHFMCLKFRSMCVDAEARKKDFLLENESDEIVFKIRKDPRVTRVGRVIRKLSIDELPQIFNVLKGDMSLVGPRPPVPLEVENYEYQYFYRLDAVPGITGLQQVSGRSDITFKRWVQLDLEYIQEQSLLKDIEIILRTIPAVISGKGAY